MTSEVVSQDFYPTQSEKRAAWRETVRATSPGRFSLARGSKYSGALLRQIRAKQARETLAAIAERDARLAQFKPLAAE